MPREITSNDELIRTLNNMRDGVEGLAEFVEGDRRWLAGERARVLAYLGIPDDGTLPKTDDENSSP
ncbi:hypothetical protein [Rhizobium sp. BK251]|uniref:hypothetical protein n=1 Tax=Rhizobium sp. BK251 TaxID=2512125 RepID=UPI001044304F|nr:hypothetical protein [Rhizobium sp. BK251]TCL65110.1 hypothetical protein EV286_1135 [Rhizobium sp. BK251]